MENPIEALYKINPENLDFESMTKDQLVGVVKFLLKSFQESQKTIDLSTKNFDDMHKIATDYKNLYLENKKYVLACLSGIDLPFGIKIVRVKEDQK